MLVCKFKEGRGRRCQGGHEIALESGRNLTMVQVVFDGLLEYRIIPVRTYEYRYHTHTISKHQKFMLPGLITVSPAFTLITHN